MKTFFIALLMVVSFNSFAQSMSCLQKLLPYNNNSGVHQVVKEEWDLGKDSLDSEAATKAMRFLTNSKLFCRDNEISVTIDSVCSQVLSDVPESLVCYLQTNLGHFVITKDRMRNLNFIFSRDKKPTL